MYVSLIYRIILTYIGQFVIMDNYRPAWWEIIGNAYFDI